MREITPAYLVFIRTAGGALVLAPIAIAKGQLRSAIRYWRAIIVYSIIEMCGPWLILFNAERHITSSLAALIVAAVPLAGTVLGAVTGTEGVDLRRGFGLLLGIGGVALLVGVSATGSQLAPALSLIVIVIGYALGPWMVANNLRGCPPIGLAAWSFIFTALVYLPFGILDWPTHALSTSVINSIIGLTIFCTILAFLFLFALVKEAGAVRATLVTYVNPGVAVILGATILNEAVHVYTIIGFALVLLGCFFAGRHPTGRQLRRTREHRVKNVDIEVKEIS